MKPTLQEQKPNGTVEVNIATSDENTKQRPSRLFTRLAVGVVSLIVLCGVILGAVYLGKKLTSDNFKEYHGLVHREGGKTTQETWRLSNKEEEFENDDVRAIYDFNTGLAAFALKNQEDDGLTDCYVVSFNLAEMKTPEDVRKELKSTEFEITEPTTVWKKYELTDVWLNEEALGERSQSVCSGKDIYFFRSIEDESQRINKRGWSVSVSVSVGSVSVTITVKSKG